ncbi:MAG: DUF3367 domain-containing protein, partial [Acidobacteria bacterium]|nr:DUF3367 domain-containing protein [Acidobacteriota bacterium]
MTEHRRTRRWADQDPDLTPRLWLILAAVPIVVGVMLQHLGRIIYISRLDRMFDPITMASRSLVLWNPYADMGSLQYQTIGYLIPFDAAFILGAVTGTPIWITERLLVATLMVVAMWGCTRLADALGIGTRVFRILGGLGYALSAVIISRVAQQQVFAMGAIFLPWALVPLVRGSQRGSTRRAAACSALAIALMGGANAAVTVAMIPIPLLYLLTRTRGPRRASLLRWWALCVPMAIAWWVAGLRLYSAFGANILQYTETARTTTAPTPIFEVVRGTADWFARLSVNGVALPSGNALAFRGVAIIGSSLLAALGLAGLSHRRLPERRFLAIVLLLGIVAVGGGFGGLFGNPLAMEYRDLLGGVLSPFRNVYKLQAWITLPLALGFVHALSTLATSRPFADARVKQALIGVGAALIVFAGAFPIWNNLLMKGNGFEAIPTAWVEAREHLDAEHTGRVLIVPGLAQQQFDWGYTQQLPLQWGSDISWATRSQAPMGGPGNIAYLDTIERSLSAGGDPDLVGYLQRGGFSQVVVAADSDFRTFGAADPQTMFDALVRSGLQVEASFGPTGYGFGGLHQIEIFAVPDPVVARTYASSALTWLSGDIESTLRIPTSVFGDRPYLLSSTPVTSPIDPDQWIITDGNQRFATNFGRNRNNRSYVLGPFETMVNGVAYSKLQLRASSPESQTVQVLDGIHSITASSVGPGVIDRALADSQPANVLDGNPLTSWRPNRIAINQTNDWGPGDQWIDIEFDEPRIVDPLSVNLLVGLLGRAEPIDVYTVTDRGRIDTRLEPITTSQSVGVTPGETRHLRVAITHDSYRRVTDVIGISELTLPGDPIIRSLRVPIDLVDQFSGPDADTPAWIFSRDSRAAGTVANPIVRDFRVPRAATVSISATGSVGSPDDVFGLLNNAQWMSIRASSTLFDAPELAARNLIDDDPSTVWVSGTAIDDPDHAPQVTLSWLDPRVVSRIRLGLDREFATPSHVTVTVNGQVFDRTPSPDGSIDIPETRTTAVQLDLHFDPTTVASPLLRAGLSGIEIPAIAGFYPGPIDRDATLSFDCGVGPGLTIGATSISYSATMTYGELMDHRQVPLVPCGSTNIDLTAGDHRVITTPGPRGIGVDQLLMGNAPTLARTDGTGRSLTIDRWGSSSRRATIGAGPENLFVVNEVFNPGWSATLDGVTLPSLEVDGWRQAFLIPAGTGGSIDLAFAPNREYQIGTFTGLGLLLLLLLLAIVPGRRRTPPAPIGAGTWSRPLTMIAGLATAVPIAGLGALLLPVL